MRKEVRHKLAALIGDNLSTESTKTTIELNLAVSPQSRVAENHTLSA